MAAKRYLLDMRRLIDSFIMIAVIFYTALHKMEPINMPVWVDEVCETPPLTEKVLAGDGC